MVLSQTRAVRSHRGDAESKTVRAKRALGEILRCVDAGSALVVLEGSSGSGKTTVLRTLASAADERLLPVYVPFADLPFPELCDWTLAALGRPGQPEPTAALADLAEDLGRRGGVLLLLVDDATSMPRAAAAAAARFARASGGGLAVLLAMAAGPRAARVREVLGSEVEVLSLDAPIEPHRIEGDRIRRPSDAATASPSPSPMPRAPDVPFPAPTPPVLPDPPAPRLPPDRPDPARSLRAAWRIPASIAVGFLVVAAVLLWLGGTVEGPPSLDAPSDGQLPPVAASGLDPRDLLSHVFGGSTEEAAAASPALRVHTGRLAPGEWLAASFRRSGLSGELAVPLAAAAAGHFDFRRSQAGDRWELVLGADGSILDFRYHSASAQPLQVRRVADELVAGVPDSVFVRVNAWPWAAIEVDGSPVGETPLANLELRVGPHRVVARYPDGRVEERLVRVDFGHRRIVFP